MDKPEDKKADILFIIKPICTAFGLKEKDYNGAANERAREIKALRVVLDAIAIKEVEL